MLTTVLIAVAVFSVPGFIVSWISGLKTPWALAASIPVSFGIFGLAAWILGMMDLRFDVRSVAVCTAAVAVLGFLWRLGFLAVAVLRRRGRPAAATTAVAEEPINQLPEFGEPLTADPHPGDVEPEDRTPRPPWWMRLYGSTRNGGLLDPRWLLPAAGSITGAWLIIDRALELLEGTTHGLADIYGGWDVHWHASMVRFIDETGIASATRMGELRNIETDQEMFYPSAWHAGAWLVSDIAGITPIEATNLTGIVLSGLLLPLGVALIAWRMINNRGLTAQIGAGFAGLAVIASPVLFWIGNYVGAWPYVAAIGSSGIVLALFMSTPAVPVRVFAAVFAFIGMFQLHPSAVTIVVMVLILWWLCQLLWFPSRRADSFGRGVLNRLRDVGILGFTGVVGMVLVLPQVLSGSEQTEEVLSYSALEDVTREESWIKAVLMETRHTDAFGDMDITWLLVFAVIGGVVALLWRGNLWAPLFYLASVALTVNSLKPFDEPWGDWLNIIGGLHYSTAHRLVMPVAMFTFAAAGIGLAAVIRLIALGPIRKFAGVSNVVSVVLALIVAVPVQAWARDLVDEGSEFSITAPHDGRMVNDADLAAWDWLSQQPGGRTKLIMGDPADGHGWMYAYNGLHSVNRHYTWPDAGPDTATYLLYWWPQLLGAGMPGDPDQENPVDRGARDLDVGFFVLSPGSFWAFQEPNLPMLEGLWTTPGVTPVYQHEQVTIFAINDAFTDAELNQMRAEGNSPNPLPPVPTRGELGIAETREEIDQPVFHRPGDGLGEALSLLRPAQPWPEDAPF
ncbi:DUF6541 family protein [Corynebacterium pacaense]|uniref:DUF6541 family protein n=1 Tax=Corynebacterium pacaense TaxID=1816684 RepID=UPI001FECF7D8|nr:DUF6541 family protein [Corynebacterium pacaense]